MNGEVEGKPPENQAIGSGIHLNYEISRQNFIGRDLSKFDQDVLKILCAVLNKTGPIRFSDADIDELDTNELVVEHNAAKNTYIAMMVVPHEGMKE